MPFSIRVDHYHHTDTEATDSILAAVLDLKETFMTTQTEVADALNAAGTQLEAATTQLGKVASEVQALKDALAAAGAADPAVLAALAKVEAAVAGVGTAVQTVDDLSPDA